MTYIFAASSTPDGGVIEVFVRPEESEPVGRAEFVIEERRLRPGPTLAEPYTKEHVVATRIGKVAHLTGFYNNTLTRKGPADIYRGFAVKLLNTVEEVCRALGAWLIYLEAAKSMVRLDPNNNNMESQDSATFYAKRGYGPDAAQQAHNSKHFRNEAATHNISPAETAQFLDSMLRSTQAAIMVKVLA